MSKNQFLSTWVFFYGTFMKPEILSQYKVFPTEIVLAKLNGFELYIRPRVNLRRFDRSCAFGALAKVSHTDLKCLYSNLQENFGLEYLPTPVLAETLEGSFIPALCYLTMNMKDSMAEQNYIDELAACIREAEFPEWYAVHVESFGTN